MPLLGLGTPSWDYGARGALFGLTRGSGGAPSSHAVSRTGCPRAASRARCTNALALNLYEQKGIIEPLVCCWETRIQNVALSSTLP